jgi:hypothetical protein
VSRFFPLLLRWILPCVALILFLSLMASGIPPSYSDIWELESRLPQNDLSTYTPGDRRFLHISGHIVGHGFNNELTQA